MPGLAKPVTIDSEQLPAEDAEELTSLVTSTGLLDEHASVSAPRPKGADYGQYTITIAAGEQSRTVRLADPVVDPKWQALISFLKTKAKDLRSRSKS